MADPAGWLLVLAVVGLGLAASLYGVGTWRASKLRAADDWHVVDILVTGERWFSLRELTLRGKETDPRLIAAVERMHADGFAERLNPDYGHPMYRLSSAGWDKVKKERWGKYH